MMSREALRAALVALCRRLDEAGAARVAEAIVAAARDPKTTVLVRALFADALAALAVVSGRLPPKEAASRASQAVDVLDSLWVARTAPGDRAPLAEALVSAWTHLDPTDVAPCAKRVAADLEDALRESRATPNEIAGLAMALAAVYNHLDPAERGGRANAVANAVLAALRRPRNHPWMISQLSEALAALCAHLDRAGTLRIADAVLAVLDDPTVQPDVSLALLGPHLDRVVLHEKLFKNVAARLAERDLQRLLDHHLVVGRLQRVFLDVLAGSKERSFRNTWDYLDSTASRGNGTEVPPPGTNR
jgi:hypothetical protein